MTDPDPYRAVNTVRCGACDSEFDTFDTYETHVCRDSVAWGLRVGVLVAALWLLMVVLLVVAGGVLGVL